MTNNKTAGKIIMFTIMVLTIATLSACNTMEGLGQDVQKGGAGIEKAADKNK